MAYPQQGATYKHTPKFIDRMKKDEGIKSTPYVQPDLDRIDQMAGDILKGNLGDKSVDTQKYASEAPAFVKQAGG
jgi:hypothetical protein